jgi:hypothetical protein
LLEDKLCPKQNVIMNAKERVDWLNKRDPLHQWSVDDDIFCLHCDGIFKAQDVAQDIEADPTCPVCHTSSPIDFREIPWWREDLVEQSADHEGVFNEWRVEPIHAEAGKPCRLPERKKMRDEQHRFLMLLGQLPARLTAEQTAWVLNCQSHDIPCLVAARLLKPLGNPPANGIKFFATVDVLELSKDRNWLTRLTSTVYQHWHKQNAKKKIAFPQSDAISVTEASGN